MLKIPLQLSTFNLLALLVKHPAHTLLARNKYSCLDHVLKAMYSAYCFVAHASITGHDSVLTFLKTSIPNSNTCAVKTIKFIVCSKIELKLLHTNFTTTKW